MLFGLICFCVDNFLVQPSTGQDFGESKFCFQWTQIFILGIQVLFYFIFQGSQQQIKLYTLKLKFEENTILVPIFWDHNQFSPYILVIVNLVPVMFNLESY